MKLYKLGTALLSAVLLVSCSGRTAELPEPQELFEAIRQEVELPEMVDLTEELLLSNTGIEEGEYSSAVCCLLSEGMGPDEIIIVRAADSKLADDIQEKLKERLAYKEEAARMYLTEYMPVIQEGIIRRDGLTVSLIVSEQSAEIVEVYKQYQ